MIYIFLNFSGVFSSFHDFKLSLSFLRLTVSNSSPKFNTSSHFNLHESIKLFPMSMYLRLLLTVFINIKTDLLSKLFFECKEFFVEKLIYFLFFIMRNNKILDYEIVFIRDIIPCTNKIAY